VDAEVRDVIHPVRKSINNMRRQKKHQLKEDIKKNLHENLIILFVQHSKSKIPWNLKQKVWRKITVKRRMRINH